MSPYTQVASIVERSTRKIFQGERIPRLTILWTLSCRLIGGAPIHAMVSTVVKGNDERGNEKGETRVR